MYKKILLLLIVFFLALIPFLWLKPGYVDLGGDSSRLYFYDPINYLKSFSLYTISPNGFNDESNGSYLIPFIIFLAGLKFFLSSPTFVVIFINSVALVTAFLSVFGIVITLLGPYVEKNRDKTSVYFAGVATGIFYTFSPSLVSLGWWTAALITHNQYFLNPLMFFLLLRYIVKKDFIYMLSFLFLSFIFSPNFFLSPYFFSFYPLAILFLFLYSRFILQNTLNIKEIILAFFLYLFIHAIHLFRIIFDLFRTNSGLSQLVFSEGGKIDRGLGYFLSVEGVTKVTNNLLGFPQGAVMETFDIRSVWIIIPLVIFIGLLLREKNLQSKYINKTLSLSMIFFLVTFYFITAKITFLSLELYKLLFYLPGFGMFRNYVGQFTHVYTFFYTLIFGICIFYIFIYLRNFYKKAVFLIVLSSIFIVAAVPFIRGDAIHIALNSGSKEEIKMPIRMDPEYEQHVLSPIRENIYDGKYLLFPMDDSGAQVLRGIDGGYMGPPTIAYLTGKSVFSGLGGLGNFYETFQSMFINKDYKGLENMLSMLNVKYLFFNSDEKIYGDTFSGYPYSRAKSVMPISTALYKDFLELLNVENKIDLGVSGKYHLYELSKSNYRPHIYVANKKYSYNSGDSIAFYPLPFKENDNRIALFESIGGLEQLEGERNGLYLEAKRKKSLLEPSFKRQDALVIDDSVPPQIYTILYPLLVVSAKIPDSDVSRPIRAEFDKGVYASSKIIKDIESHSKNKIIDAAFLEKELEAYKKSVIIHINSLRLTKTIFDPSMYVVKLNKIIISDKNKISFLIKNSNNTEKEKRDLLFVIDRVFSEIGRYTGANAGIPVSTTYTINPSESGTFSMYVEKRTMPDSGLGTSVFTEGKSFGFQSAQADDYWIHIGDLGMEKGKIFSFDFTMLDNEDFMKKTLGVTLDDFSKMPYAANLITKGQSLLAISNSIRNVFDWKEYETYIISFEFREKNTNNPWKKYRVFVETGDNVEEAHVFIMNTQYDTTQDIRDFYIGTEMDVRNLFIANYSWPKIVVRKEVERNRSKLPSITFTKINPTKYKVHVSGVTEPYTIVLQDIFNQNWKVFLRDKEEVKDEGIVASYYGGTVNEGKHTNEFLAVSTFETWGKRPIAEKKHSRVNVYANAWDISPEDIGGKTDYTLIIELTSQQTLYILLFTSLTAVMACLVWIIILFLKKRKKYKLVS